MTSPDDLRALADQLDSLLSEVWRAHCDKESPDWNDCESSECQWCVETKAAMVDLRALVAAQQTPQEFFVNNGSGFCTHCCLPMGSHRLQCPRDFVAHETPVPRPAEDTTP